MGCCFFHTPPHGRPPPPRMVCPLPHGLPPPLPHAWFATPAWSPPPHGLPPPPHMVCLYALCNTKTRYAMERKCMCATTDSRDCVALLLPPHPPHPQDHETARVAQPFSLLPSLGSARWRGPRHPPTPRGQGLHRPFDPSLLCDHKPTGVTQPFHCPGCMGRIGDLFRSETVGSTQPIHFSPSGKLVSNGGA